MKISILSIILILTTIIQIYAIQSLVKARRIQKQISSRLDKIERKFK
jgi:hypothetical protein